MSTWGWTYCVCFNTRKGLQKNIQTWLKVRTKKSVLSPNKEYGGWGIKLIPQFIIRFLSKKLSGKIILYSKINRSINKNHQKKSYILYRIILVQKDTVLPKPEWWRELSKFCPTFITEKSRFCNTQILCLFQLMHVTKWTNNLYNNITYL